MTAENKRLEVGVIFGGRSGEHEVSLASAASVIRALDPEEIRSRAHRDHERRAMVRGNAGAEDAAGRAAAGTARDAERRPERRRPGAARRRAPAAGSQRVDVIFPVLHGTYGEDGTVQGLLDLAGLPYVGSGVIGSAVGMDKDMQKRLFQQARLPVGEFLAILRSEWEKGRERVLKLVAKKFRFPLFVKPATLGSSVGMSKVHKRAELPAALDLAAEFAQKIVVERNIRGREIEVSVLGNDEPQAVGARRNHSSPRILRLHGEISGGRHAPGNSGQAFQSAGAEIPGVRRARVPLPGMPRHGARGFLSGEAERAHLS